MSTTCTAAVAGDEILRAVASQIKSMAGECKYLASFGAGRFAALLPDASDAQALAWAETVRQAVAHLELPCKHETVCVTASLGVAGTMNGITSADELIKRAETAVRMAKSSGRNCVARCGQFDGETREWEDLARQGRLFENTVARDVMVPCPQFVLADQDAERRRRIARTIAAHANCRSSTATAACWACSAPISCRTTRTASRKKAKVSDFMVQDVATVPENESFGALMEFFMSDNQSHHVVIVVRHDQPLGHGLPQRSGGLERTAECRQLRTRPTLLAHQPVSGHPRRRLDDLTPAGPREHGLARSAHRREPVRADGLGSSTPVRRRRSR